MAPSKRKNLQLRIISAIVILLPSFFAIQQGSPYFNILLGLFGLAMTWEWVRLCSNDTFGLGGYVFAGGLVCLCFFPLMIPDWGNEEAYFLLFATMLGVFFTSLWHPHKILLSFGVLYLGLGLLGFLSLQAESWLMIVWLCGCVVVTDTGAYIAGTTIGGAKIAPKISPNKTWAGLLGGMAAAACISFVIAFIVDWHAPFILAILAAVIALVAQAGDFFESHIKRKFGKKDSSHLIPGHGGVLDRMDGMLSASLFFTLLLLVTDRAILSWF